jgi:UDP-glucuronate decarboxylase
LQTTGIVTLEDLGPLESLLNFDIDFDRLQNQNILLTGSQGMLGRGLSVVLRSLVATGKLHCNLFLASREWRQEDLIQKTSGIEFISNQEARKRKIPFDLIIHCASPSNITKIQTLEELSDINYRYLEDCISHSTSKVIFISSGEVYQGKETRVSLTLNLPHLTEKRNWYPYIKLQTENKLDLLSFERGFSLVVMRLFHTFGPGMHRDDGRSFSDIIYGAEISGKIVLKSAGTHVRSFLFLTDAIRAILMCLTSGSESRVLNVGSSEPRSILEFAKIVSNITGSKIEFQDVDFEHSPFEVIVPDISEIKSLGWLPEIDLEEGINRTLKWVQKQNF